jgi:xylan 1,4-beta-xylosidase
VWNEPDIGYWRGTPEEYLKLYDYAADGLKRALPTARIGGPHMTGPNGARTQQLLRAFIDHCLHGVNYATGKVGSPLDYVGFHAKGAPQVTPAGFVRMNLGTHLRAIANGFAIVGSFPELSRTPVVIGESDPEGCAACPIRTNPANAYRNGTMYSSYTAEQLARTYQLADRHRVNLIGAVTWAFEFEGQPYFDGFRDLSTNGVDKPVLNVFRMLGKMTGQRVAAVSSGAPPLDEVREKSVRGAPDIGALASRDARSAAVLLWHYHDDNIPGPASNVSLSVSGLPVREASLTHFRIDEDHSNAYSAWLRMGSPATPSPAQRARLERAGHLETLEPPRRIAVRHGQALVELTLPRQAVSLVHLAW